MKLSKMVPHPETDVTNLLLIRHGATPPNEQRPFILQGCGINPSLSESGQKQAAALGQFLSSTSPIHHVYCSPMTRARETAEAICEPLGLTPQEVAEIHECDVGLWEGKSWDIIMQEFPEAYEAFIHDPYQNRYEGGESYGDVLNRTEPAIQSLLDRHLGETIVAVAASGNKQGQRSCTDQYRDQPHPLPAGRNESHHDELHLSPEWDSALISLASLQWVLSNSR